MGTSVTGKLNLDKTDPNFHIETLRIVVKDESALFPFALNGPDAPASANSSQPHADNVQSDGTFSVIITAAGSGTSATTRQLSLCVYTSCFRQVKTTSQAEASGDVTDFGSIKIPLAECSGYTVTLGGSTAALKVNEGNTVRPLIDGEDAWAYLGTKMNAAQKSIYVMQLAFDTPKSTAPNPEQESPEVVLSFDTPYDPTTLQPPTIPNNARPERILIDNTSQPSGPRLDVRVIMSGSQESTLLAVVEGVAVAIGLIALTASALDADNIEDALKALGKSVLTTLKIALCVCFLLIVVACLNFQGAGSRLVDLIDGRFSGKKGLEQYLQDYKSVVDFQKFPMPMAQWVHSKMVIVDDVEVVALGSPFHQSYWDTHDHYIYEPRRGSASDEPTPVHDISMSVRGPALKDMHDSYRMHWNVAEPARKIAAIDPPEALTSPDTGEHLAALQLVRTLNAGLFDWLDSADKYQFDKNGEKGILEAYLRAIENAQDFIYLENQYFTNKTIANALVAALKDTSRPNLQIIMVLNVTPDAPFYPFWQWRRIKQIRDAAAAFDVLTNAPGETASRIGFFATWSHNPAIADPSNQIVAPKAIIAGNYIHSKFGMVDGKWLTVGSGNLDGLSLETSDYLGFLPGNDRRDHELNFCIFNGIDGASTTDAIDAFRQNLWAEHLGFVNGDGTINPDADELKTRPDDGWLSLFRSQAAKKATALANAPKVPNKADGRVLEWPTDTLGEFLLFIGRSNAERDFLEKSKVPFTDLDLVSKVRAYDFLKKRWM